MASVDSVMNAVEFAKEKHGNQRYGDLPYLFHLHSVAWQAEIIRLKCLPTCDRHVIFCAAYLHDVLEDTDAKYSDLVSGWGEEVAEIVYAVTDELGRNRTERKAKTYPKIVGNKQALLIKLADRIANVKHAIEQGNNQILKMYRREQEEFALHLRMTGNQFEPIWNELERLLNG